MSRGLPLRRPSANRITNPIGAVRPGQPVGLNLAEHLGVDAVACGVLAGAACAALADPDVMFPDPRDKPGTTTAKQVCAACPVSRTECLRRFGTLPFGVVAGLTVKERTRVGGDAERVHCESPARAGWSS